MNLKTGGGCQQAVTKNCDERYQSAKDRLIDLRNFKRMLRVEAEIDRTISPELRDAQSTRSTSDGQKTSAAAFEVGPGTATSGAAPTASSAEYIVPRIKQ